MIGGSGCEPMPNMERLDLVLPFYMREEECLQCYRIIGSKTTDSRLTLGSGFPLNYGANETAFWVNLDQSLRAFKWGFGQ